MNDLFLSNILFQIGDLKVTAISIYIILCFKDFAIHKLIFSFMLIHSLL